jgi:outer membrane protein insertion porin family
MLAVLALLMAMSGWGAASAGEKPPPQKEQPTVQEISIIGMRNDRTVPLVTVRPDEVKANMRTREGKPLRQNVLNEDVNRIVRMGKFADVQFHLEDVEGGVHLKVLVEEKAPIRRIVYRGNSQVRTGILEDRTESQVGQAFSPGVANQDVRRIEEWYRENHYYYTDVDFRTEPFEDGVRLVFEIDERGKVEIKDITFHGNTVFTKKELIEHMETRPSSFFSTPKFDRTTFERDLERLSLLYRSKGYLDATVEEMPFEVTSRTPETKWQRQQLHIHIRIREGEQYEIGEVQFDIEPPDGKDEPVRTSEALRGVVESMPGQPYDAVQVDEDVAAIRSFYGEKGRIFTVVSAERRDYLEGNVADVIFHVKESKPVRVGEIHITGLERTQERVVRREFDIYPGEVFTAEKLKQTVRNLNRLNFFRPMDPSSSKYVQRGSEDGEADILFDLQERETGRISAGVGYSSSDGLIGQIALKQRNFDYTDHPENIRELLTMQAYQGAGQKFSLNVASGSETDELSVDFLNPWIFNRPIRFGFGMYTRNREWDSHDEERAGFYLLLGRRLFGRHWDLEAKYRLENVDIDDVHPNASNYLKAEAGDNWISRVSVELSYDSRDDIFQPTEGWYGHARQEVAGGLFGGTKDYWRTHLEVNRFWSFFRDEQDRAHTVTFRAEAGFADAYGDDDAVPFYDRYYAGGIGSVRGFDFHSISPYDSAGDPIGGEAMAAASVEYFFPLIGKKMRGSVFYDVGGAWADADSFGDPWRSSAGVGLHMVTPLGPMPVRLYYCHPISEEPGDDTGNIQFNIGAYF